MVGVTPVRLGKRAGVIELFSARVNLFDSGNRSCICCLDENPTAILAASILGGGGDENLVAGRPVFFRI